MTGRYLEVTFRGGRPIAAYYYLPRRPGQKSYRTMLADPGIVVDFSRNGKPIGIEITAPSKISLSAINRVFRKLGLETIKSSDLAPLLTA
jgi:uncharacterized protein YuzE